MQRAATKCQPDTQLLFLPSVFNETLSLLFDAHQYFEARGAEEHATIAADKRDYYTSEVGLVSLRLTSIMAWIMVRRAVHAGNIKPQKAEKDYRLDARDRYLSAAPEMIDELPYYLAYLSTRSLNLYERVMRLDTMAYDTKH